MSEAEYVFGADAERDDSLHVARRARARGTGDLDGSASLTALAEYDGVRAALVSACLPGSAFRAIGGARYGGFPRLGAEIRICDARFGDELDERKT